MDTTQNFLKTIITKYLSSSFEFELDPFGKEAVSVTTVAIYKKVIVRLNNRIIFTGKDFRIFFAPRIIVLQDGREIEIKLSLKDQRYHFSVYLNGKELKHTAKYKLGLGCGGLVIYGFMLAVAASLNMKSEELAEFGIDNHSMFVGIFYVICGFFIIKKRSARLTYAVMLLFAAEAILSQIIAPHYSPVWFHVLVVLGKLSFLPAFYAESVINLKTIKENEILKPIAAPFLKKDAMPELLGEWRNADKGTYILSFGGNFIFCPDNKDDAIELCEYQVEDGVLLLHRGEEEICRWPYEINSGHLTFSVDGVRTRFQKAESFVPRMSALITKGQLDQCFAFPLRYAQPQNN